MDLIITYMLEKGGIFGLLLAISILWIAFREKQLSTKSTSKADCISSDLNTVLENIHDIKETQKLASEALITISPILDKILMLEQNEDSGLGSIGVGIKDIDIRLEKIGRYTRELHEWHSLKKPDGSPIWYPDLSTSKSLNKIENSLDSLKDAVVYIKNEIHSSSDLEKKIDKIHEVRIVELKSLLELYNKTITDLILELEKLKITLENNN